MLSASPGTQAVQTIPCPLILSYCSLCLHCPHWPAEQKSSFTFPMKRHFPEASPTPPGRASPSLPSAHNSSVCHTAVGPHRSVSPMPGLGAPGAEAPALSTEQVSAGQGGAEKRGSCPAPSRRGQRPREPLAAPSGQQPGGGGRPARDPPSPTSRGNGNPFVSSEKSRTRQTPDVERREQQGHVGRRRGSGLQQGSAVCCGNSCLWCFSHLLAAPTASEAAKLTLGPQRPQVRGFFC